MTSGNVGNKSKEYWTLSLPPRVFSRSGEVKKGKEGKMSRGLSHLLIVIKLPFKLGEMPKPTV